MRAQFFLPTTSRDIRQPDCVPVPESQFQSALEATAFQAARTATRLSQILASEKPRDLSSVCLPLLVIKIPVDSASNGC